MNEILALEHGADLLREAEAYRRSASRADRARRALPRRALHLALPHWHGTTATGCEA